MTDVEKTLEQLEDDLARARQTQYAVRDRIAELEVLIRAKRKVVRAEELVLADTLIVREYARRMIRHAHVILSLPGVAHPDALLFPESRNPRVREARQQLVWFLMKKKGWTDRRTAAVFGRQRMGSFFATIERKRRISARYEAVLEAVVLALETSE